MTIADKLADTLRAIINATGGNPPDWLTAELLAGEQALMEYDATKDVSGGGVADIVTRDCGYGFSAHAVLADGTQAYHTTRLHATSEQAQKEVAARAALSEQQS